ncbi:MAG: hypothetical protein HY580_06775 [Nitrospinae bacterium]|nr:hypothetical protein [Nitrospinota bacterium]
MNAMDRPDQPGEGSLPLKTWISIFKECVVPDDAGDDVVRALILHLADLGLFFPAGEEAWSVSGIDPAQSPAVIGEAIAMRVESLGHFEQGRFLPYFLRRRAGEALPGIPGAAGAPQPPVPAPDSGSAEKTLEGRRVSDLSNLQIVKKVGRQFQPFLEMEKKFFETVVGRYTSREDAGRLFNYILAQTQEKGKSRPWEQLSRRRHK